MEETLALQIWINGSLMFLDFSFHSERQAKSKARTRPLDTCWQHHVPTIAGEQQSKDCKDHPNPAVSLETRWAPRRWHSQHLPTIMGPRNFKVLTCSHWASPHITSPCIIWVYVIIFKKKRILYLGHSSESPSLSNQVNPVNQVKLCRAPGAGAIGP